MCVCVCGWGGGKGDGVAGRDICFPVEPNASLFPFFTEMMKKVRMITFKQKVIQK